MTRLLYYCHIAVDEQTSVKSGYRCLQVERLDEHCHPTWGPPARYGEKDACFAQCVNSVDSLVS